MTKPNADEGLQRLFRSMPQIGHVQWIGVRPGKGEPMNVVRNVTVSAKLGIDGDRFDGGRTKERQVTLIQQEHLEAVANILGRDAIDPSQTRRNLVVSGINLQALKQARFRVGTALLEGTSNCAPCSQMEQNLGVGGYNAMRGHGGLCAQVVEDGEICVGDDVRFVELVA